MRWCAEYARLEGIILYPRLLAIFGLFLSPVWCASSAEDIEVEADEFLKVFAQDAKLEKIAQGLVTTDGPVFSRMGFLLFCDTSAQSILKHVPGAAGSPGSDTAFVAYRRNSGGARGLTFDRQGRLIACEAAAKRVTRTEKDGSIAVLAQHFQGKALNGPRDVVHAIDGSTYFTDPAAENAASSNAHSNLSPSLYQITSRGELRLLTTKVSVPTGVTLSPNQQRLYVSDSGDQSIWVHTFRPDGSVNEAKLFARLESRRPGSVGGIKTGESGHVLCIGPGGIWVFDEMGKHLGTVRLPEPASNLTWSYRKKALYITAGHSLYSIPILSLGTRTF